MELYQFQLYLIILKLFILIIQKNQQIFQRLFVNTENIIKIDNFHLIKQKRISNDINKQKLNIVASIPYIGKKYAERLLKNFKTVKNIINISPQELSSKAKIPYKTSIKIWRILNEEYKR